MKSLKQMLWEAALWEERVPVKQLPYFFDDEHACPKKFPEVPRLCRRRPNTARHPILYVLDQFLKVKHMPSLILADVVVGRLDGGHCFEKIRP